MSNEKEAKNVFRTIIKAFDSEDYKYTVNEEELTVTITFKTDDLSATFKFIVDAERDLVRLLSFLPLSFSEEKRVDGALATVVANHNMINGSFDFDLSDGEIVFKMTTSYRGGVIDEACILYMLNVSLNMVDRYNDRFYDLSLGKMDLKEFIDKENESEN